MTKPDLKTKGAIEILCKEIDFPFHKKLETTEMLLAFVRQLVSHIEEMRYIKQHLVEMGGKAASKDSEKILTRVLHMFTTKDKALLIKRADSIHRAIHIVAPDDMYPCDHLIDMLSSCVSAIRFGLESPCHSRHAAEAAGHIWEHVYGVGRFDGFTSNWQKEWARAQLQIAIIGELP